MSMKVFDLQCPQGHVFEGWFRGAQGFDEQRDKGLLSCPVCDSTDITRKLSAARLNLSRSSDASELTAAPDSDEGQSVSRPDEATLARLGQMQAQWLQHMRQVVSQTEDVGDQFAKQARDMHAGRTEERPIRGTVTQQERRELADEGVDLLLVPDFLDDDQHH